MFTFNLFAALRLSGLNQQTKDFISQLKEEPNKVITQLYRDYRKEFISWAYSHYGCDMEIATDCFQDAVIVFYGNIKSQKITELQSNIKTYLFAIGKNLILKKFNKNKKEIPLSDDVDKFSDEDHFIVPELYEGNSREKVVAQTLLNMQDPCKSILRNYYYRGLDMSEIAVEMAYKNADTVKSQKVRCIKELKRLVNKELSKNTI